MNILKQRGNRGYLLVEVILIVGIAATVCAAALHATAMQHKDIKRMEASVEETQAKESSNWMLVEGEGGSRIWQRQF